MKIDFKIFIFIGIISLLVTGCGNKQEGSNNENAMAVAVKQQEDDTIGEIKARETVQIKSIVGNELTVEILKEKEGIQDLGQSKSDTQGAQMRNKQKNQEGAQVPQGMPGPEGFGEMGPGRGQGRQGGNSSDAVKERIAARFEHTEETKVITIPVGASIASRGMSDTSSELGISDLTKDSYIIILYGDENKEQIVGVQVLS